MSIGFIGAGRVTKILLGGLKKSDALPETVVVADASPEVLKGLKEAFPKITMTSDNREAASQDLIFIALHPPLIMSTLHEIRHHLTPASILVSLAAKPALAALSEGLDGTSKIVRMLPNAPSLINEGYNPVVFSESIPAAEKAELLNLFKVWGACPEVPEELLPSYALITAMSPAYFWFQLYELQALGRSFGLSEKAIEEGLEQCVIGTVKTMFRSGLPPQEVMNLIPVKPLGDEEAHIKHLYGTRLEAFFEKLKSP